MKNPAMTFWLAQSGETVWANEGRIRGITDLPLSDSGRAMTIEDSRRFERAHDVSVVLHPPDEAATETGKIFSNVMETKAKAVEGLVDPDLGLLEGMTQQVFAERYPKRYKSWREDPLTLSPPDGEDVILARERLFNEIARVIKKSRGSEVVLILHDLGLGMLRCWLTGQPSTELWTLVRERPRIERYTLTSSMLQQLQKISETEVSSV